MINNILTDQLVGFLPICRQLHIKIRIVRSACGLYAVNGSISHVSRSYRNCCNYTEDHRNKFFEHKIAPLQIVLFPEFYTNKKSPDISIKGRIYSRFHPSLYTLCNFFKIHNFAYTSFALGNGSETPFIGRTQRRCAWYCGTLPSQLTGNSLWTVFRAFTLYNAFLINVFMIWYILNIARKKFFVNRLFSHIKGGFII